MKGISVLIAATFLFCVPPSRADTPAGFAWVNLETDKTMMAEVRHALQNASISAIREVGVEGGFALVMTTSREADAPTPDYDQWHIYNISLQTGKSQLLVFGYGVKLLDWIGPKNNELAITYYDCWECEAATLFTALHFTRDIGWAARWQNKTQATDFPQPGAVALMTDIGEPYGDNEVNQVFAVVAQQSNGFAAGSWLHSRDNKTGKVDDDVLRYSIDAKTGNDRVDKLMGQAALTWERLICTQSSVIIQPSIGQNSRACRSVLQTVTKKK